MSILPETTNENQMIKTPSGELITIGTYKEIYDQIVKSNQKINKQFFNNLLIDFNSIKNLYYKIVQLSKQEHFECVDSATKIVVSRVNDESQSFVSFETFEQNATSQDQATIQIIIEYSFCLKNYKTGEVSHYEVNIKISSKLGIEADLARSNNVPRHFHSNVLKMVPTVDFSMKYENYLTTLSFAKAVEEWVNTCNSSDGKLNTVFKYLQNYSHYFSLISKIIVIALVAFIFNTKYGMKLEINDLNGLAIFLINFGCYFLIMLFISNIFGDKLERMIDSYKSISFVNFNAADNKLIKNAAPNMIKSFGNQIIILFLNVIAGVIASIIFTNFL